MVCLRVSAFARELLFVPTIFNMKCYYSLSIIIILIAIVSVKAKIVAKDGKTCYCPMIHKPVCSNDGKPFSNRCFAKCSGYKDEDLVKGECKNVECVCSKESKPVCGSDGKTFDNACVAKCAGVTVVQQGPCQDDTPTAAPATNSCLCTLEYKPVCSADGETFPNACKAKCAGHTDFTSGKCRKQTDGCVCPKIYDPVCSSEGQTFSNKCEAACAGVVNDELKSGACATADTTAQDCLFCPSEYTPVCAAGKTFANSCEAECKGFAKHINGVCKPEEIVVVKPDHSPNGSQKFDPLYSLMASVAATIILIL